ncbi:MAG: hypothetical protein WAU91_04625 [Desulfatitalea sp.]
MKKTINAFSFISLVVLMTLTGCASTTLFKSDFDPGVIGQPPAHTQPVGTADVSGSVVVIGPPVSPSGKWVAIRRAATPPDQSPSPLVIFQGNLVNSKGAGIYTFSTVLHMPSGTNNVATIQFDRFGSPVSDVTGGFLHIDFLPDNTVRIDDKDNTKFGQFPRNQVFIVQVTLNINPTAPTARIVLSGAGAMGETTYAITTPVFVSWAQQFGAVKLWMGFPRTGEFDATQIVVTYKKP